VSARAPGRAARRLLLAMTLVLAVVSGVLVGQVTASPAKAMTAAAMLKSFDAGDIMSDQVMFNPSTMSQASIQAFLDKEVPTCQGAAHQTGLPCLKDYRQTTTSRSSDPMCRSYTGAKSEPAAAIILKVAKACNVNPQVLLVILQKEQSLVTDTWPTSSQYRKATGYGCPDSTAVCDATYNGFYNQVYKAAWALVRYTMPRGTGPGTDYYSVYSAYPVGGTAHILYQDPYSNSGCGTKTVTVKNKATHSLYYYTPYTPNSAALAAGWGSGDSCSAYGNRNFFLYFTQWFGSTHYTVTGAIKTLWSSLGGATGTLGNPVANAVADSANGGGTRQTFQRGTVYSSHAGTFALQGAIRSEYNRRGGSTSSLAWPSGPQRSVSANGGGTSQAFTGGDIYASSRGAYAVRLDIRAAYAKAGGVSGTLGFPIATAAGLAGGSVQRFARGSVYYSSATGAWPVSGSADSHFTAVKGPSGPLGWPKAAAAAKSGSGTTGTVQAFQKGELYSSRAGTAAVTGAVRTFYAAKGLQSGSLGWPVSDGVAVTAAGGGARQVFMKGRVYVPASGRAESVSGSALTTYVARGEAAGSLGWPIAAEATVSAHGTSGRVQAFQGGSTYVMGGATRTVTGTIYKDYQHNRGPAGSLGWPTGPAKSSTASGGGWSQTFAGGSIFYSSRTKEAHPLTGAFLKVYLQRGGVTSTLGWPGAKQSLTTHGGGSLVVFTSGRIYSSSAGIYAVRTGVLAKYLALNGPSGRLGWPKGNAHSTNGAWVQSFQHGTITCPAKGSTTVKYS
jgi:uncharacterized protein with LGFP repeats